MLKVTNCKIQLSKCSSSNDMSHFFPSHYSVMGSNWYYMSPEDYMNKKEFSEFNMSPEGFTKDQTNEMVKRVMENSDPIDHVESLFNPALRYVYNMQQQIKKSGGNLTWQYNVVGGNLDSWYRQMVCLGGVKDCPDLRLRVVTPFELYVKLPILNFVCKIMNKLHHNKAIKEVREWERYLKNIHNKKEK